MYSRWHMSATNVNLLVRTYISDDPGGLQLVSQDLKRSQNSAIVWRTLLRIAALMLAPGAVS